MQFLCFLGFCVLWFVQWLCHLLPLGFDWPQGFMCVCAQVGCSVVCNWSLRDLFVDVCILIYLGFNLLSIIFNFFSFVCSWDTRRRIKSKNTIRVMFSMFPLPHLTYSIMDNLAATHERSSTGQRLLWQWTWSTFNVRNMCGWSMSAHEQLEGRKFHLALRSENIIQRLTDMIRTCEHTFSD
jgi:hypothetical protein